MNKINYDFWPNTDGNLGNIKVAIPDGTTVKWPEGDALVGNFVYKDGKLAGLVDTKALIANESGTTTINYDYVNAKFDSIIDGTMVFERGPRCKYFTVEVAPYIPDYISFELLNDSDKALLRSATKIIDDVLYDVDDNEIGTFKTINLTSGSNIVYNNLVASTTDGKEQSSLFSTSLNTDITIPLTTFESSLASLENGANMFQQSNIISFVGDLSSLKNGEYMFQSAVDMTTFKTSADSSYVDLSSLENGSYMFYQCNGLTSFEGDLSKLKVGRHMFYHCKNLTHFDADLSSLTNGFQMFAMCTVNTSMLKNIARTINDVRGLENGPDSSSTVYKRIYFALENYSASDEDKVYLTEIHNKGWAVYLSTIFGSSEFTPE